MVIDDDLAVSAATADVSGDIIPDTVTLPGGVQQPLHPIRCRVPGRLGQRPPVFDGQQRYSNQPRTYARDHRSARARLEYQNFRGG
jgi:hypothetical protein